MEPGVPDLAALLGGEIGAALQLVSTSVTGTGVIIATYAPAGPPRHGSYALPGES